MAQLRPSVRICSDRCGFGAFCLVAVCERLGLSCEVSHGSGVGTGGGAHPSNSGFSDLRPCVIIGGDGAASSSGVAVGGLRVALNFLLDSHPKETAEAFPLLSKNARQESQLPVWAERQWIDFVLLKLQPALAGVQHRRIRNLLWEVQCRMNAVSSEDKRLVEETALLFKGKPGKGSLSSLLLYATLRFHHWAGLPKGYEDLSEVLEEVQTRPEVVAATAAVRPPPPVSVSLTDGLFAPQTQPRASKTFYVTTAISYTNGPPHMGHAYEAVVADCLARFHQVLGEDVYFVTGTDEHGLKIATAAAAAEKTPLEFCDGHVEKFKALLRAANVNPSFFIRTTMESHKKVCQHLWMRCHANGDIYLGTYKGWYLQREETFVTQRDAEAWAFKDPVTGRPLEQMEEESYFFRMSRYQDRLLEYIRETPDFISPPEKRQEILTRLSEPLQDLSVSRASFSWGVPVPGDSRHVMYVWFDALTNYISAIRLQDPSRDDKAALWPPDVQVIGKDIAWFHCVIWPIMLMSAGLPLPRKVFAHGFVLGADGEKMSKSLGNGVDPFDALSKFGADPFRYFLLKEAPLGADLRFDCDALSLLADSDLANALGNLVHRAAALCGKICGGKVPPPVYERVSSESEDDDALMAANATYIPPFDVAALVREVESCFQQLRLREALEATMQAVRDTNKWLSDRAPWLNPNRLQAAEDIRITLECIYTFTHLLVPFIPAAAEKIFQRLNTPPKKLFELSRWLRNLAPGTVVQSEAEVLFANRQSKGDGEGARKQQSHAVPQEQVQRLDLKVACVEKAELHPLCLKDPKMAPYILLRLRLQDAQPQLNLAVMKLDSQEEVTAASALVSGKKVVVAANIKEPIVKGVNPSHSVVATRLEGRLCLLQPNNPECPLGAAVAVHSLPPKPRPNDRLKPQQLQEVFLKHLEQETGRVVYRHQNSANLPLQCGAEGNLDCGVAPLFLQ